jgi:hypothetical protein
VTHADKVIKDAVKDFKKILSDHEAGGPEAAVIVVVEVRAYYDTDKESWAWTGDAVTADRALGGSDYTGDDDLGLGEDASAELVAHKIAESIKAKGFTIDDGALIKILSDDSDGSCLERAWNGERWA